MRRFTKQIRVPGFIGLADCGHEPRAVLEEDPREVAEEVHVAIELGQGSVEVGEGIPVSLRRPVDRRKRLPPRRLSVHAVASRQRSGEVTEPHRFGHVVVIARRQTHLAVAAHRSRGHRHDGDVAACLSLTVTETTHGFQSVHHGHLYIHQNDVEGFGFERIERLLAVTDDLGFMAKLGQEPDRERLVDGIVFRDEHSEPPAWSDRCSSPRVRLA